MTLSNDIENVRVYELAGGIFEDGSSFASPRFALVKWKSDLSSKLYQVYVNGQYAGVTHDPVDRQLVVPVPMFFDVPVRIEVFAVEPSQAQVDFSDELEFSAVQSGRVKIVLVRSQELPLDSVFDIYFDNGTGVIDYDNPVTERSLRVWPIWQDKAGFGMSGFGVGDFGFDAAAAVGLGMGCFGCGGFGLDADAIEWVSEPLPAGVYKFAIKITDSNGNLSSSALTREVTLTPLARPAENLSVFSFDNVAGQLVFGVE